MAKSWRYPTGKSQSEKEHTIQWPKVGDTFTRWVSPTVGHCTVCSFSIRGLPVGYLQLLAIILYVLSRFVVYPLGISNCWPLYCMFFLDSWFTRWVSSTVGHCIVCSFSLCDLPVGYHQLLAIVLYVLSRFVVYPLGIINFWPLYCMFFLALWFTRWVSSGQRLMIPNG
jgi:hypothetical protein